MGDQFVTTLVTKTDELARRLQQWNEWRLEAKLASERCTIDIRVKQESNALATQMVIKELQSNQRWIEQRREQLRLQQLQDKRLHNYLRWITDTIRKSASSTIFLVLGAVLTTGWGWVWGVNTPSTVVCKSSTSFCYQMRFWGTKLTTNELSKTQCKKIRNRTVCELPDPVDLSEI